MTAAVINGRAIARRWRRAYAARVADLRQSGTTPKLAVVIVGHDPASKVYVRTKARASIETGMRSVIYELAVSTSQKAVLRLIARLNTDCAVHGILVQLPLP